MQKTLSNGQVVEAVAVVDQNGDFQASGPGGPGGGDASAANQVAQTAILGSIDGIYAEIVDQPNATTTFICQAPVGTAASAAAWRCRRIVVNGTTTTTTWAGGGAFNQVAANRASLTYA